MTEPLTIRHAELDGSIVDIRCRDGMIEAIGEQRAPIGGVVDAAGGAVLPGLHDDHLHLLAMAAARASVELGAPSITDAATFDATLAATAPDASGWVRGVGYHETTAGPRDRDRLDRVAPGRPVHIQHATGAMWVLNSSALAQLDLEDDDHPAIERDATGRATGPAVRRRSPLPHERDAARRRRHRTPAGALRRDRRDRPDADRRPGIRQHPRRTRARHRLLPGRHGDRWARTPRIGRRAAPSWTGEAAGRRARHADDRRPRNHDRPRPPARPSGGLPLRQPDRPGHRARRLGAHRHSRWRPHRTRRGHPGRADSDDPGPRPARCDATDLRRDRGDRYLANVPADEHTDLWRCATLLAAGVAGSSDAPYGSDDPWAAMLTAAERRTAGGRRFGDAERIDTATALGLYLGSPDSPSVPRTVAAGHPARLCVLDRPLDAVLARLHEVGVVGTVARNGWDPT